MEETRTKNHPDYQNLYKAQEFDLKTSYAELLASVYVAMTYGFMMPLLFVTTFLQLVVLFYRDKILSNLTF